MFLLLLRGSTYRGSCIQGLHQVTPISPGYKPLCKSPLVTKGRKVVCNGLSQDCSFLFFSYHSPSVDTSVKL